jgi:single-stranded DNA-binding protein
MHGNSITFVGNVSQQPKLVNSGKSVKLSIGWNERPKPDGTKGRTVYMDVFVNGKQGENVLESVNVGERIVVIGSMSSYLDTTHNVSRHSLTAELVAKTMEFTVLPAGERPAPAEANDDGAYDDEEEEPAPAARASKPAPARAASRSRVGKSAPARQPIDQDAEF